MGLKLPDDLMKSCRMWEPKLHEHLPVVRAPTAHRESIENILIHAFEDVSGHGVAAATYAVYLATVWYQPRVSCFTRSACQARPYYS